MNEFLSFLENIPEMIRDNGAFKLILLTILTFGLNIAAFQMDYLQKKSETERFEQTKPESFFDSLRKNAKNNSIAAKVTILAEKIKQIPEDKLEGSRLEEYYLPELYSIVKTHSSLPVSEKKDKEVFDAIEAVEDVVDTLLNDIQKEKELTLDVNVKVLKQMAQADSEGDTFEISE